MIPRAVRVAAIVAATLQPVLASAQPAPARILVMPFDNVRRDGRIFWLGEAAAVLITDDLNGLGAGAITRPERLEAFERLQVPPAASLTDATVIRIGQLVGAGQAVIGTLELDGDAILVRARSIALESGRVQADVVDRGPVADLFAIFDRVSRRLAPAPSGNSIENQHPPLAAFESFIKGLLADTPDTAISYLNAALTIQPTFDRARLALWDVYTDEGEYDRALIAVQAVGAGSAYRRRARFLAGLSQLSLKRHDDAFQTFKALADEQATAPILNNLGVVQLRRGASPQGGTPTYYFNKAAETDGDDADYFFNLGYAYWEVKDPQAAIYFLREAVRRKQSDGEAHYVLGAALATAGNIAEATREKELARRLSSMFEEWDRRPAADAIPRGLERTKNDVELPHASRIETAIATSEQRDQQELARFYLDRGRRLYQQENDREATAELNRALYLSPYLAEAHVLVGRIDLRGGRVHDAIDAFKIAMWSAETAEAHAALADAYRQTNDIDAARREAERALVLDPMSSEARRLLDVLKSP